MEIDRQSYDLERDELRLENERDEQIILQSQLNIKKIENDIKKWELQIKKAKLRIEEREKQITWITNRLNG